MCNQITYKLACEHVHTQITYCGAAPPPSPSPSSSKKDAHGTKNGSDRKPCTNLSCQSVSYPPPPGFDQRAVPKCPLPDCPFEIRNRCWNCCWCGKGWNVGGRCSCIMIIDGNEYRCEHLCCSTCEAASD